MYNDFEGGDDEGGGGISPSVNYGYGNNVGNNSLKRRQGSSSRGHSSSYNNSNLKSEFSSDLEKTYGVRTAPGVARVFDTIDTWVQLTGR
jgi:hypothetical protein